MLYLVDCVGRGDRAAAHYADTLDALQLPDAVFDTPYPRNMLSVCTSAIRSAYCGACCSRFRLAHKSCLEVYKRLACWGEVN